MAIRSSSRVRSPTEIEKYSKSPTAYLMDKWVMKRYTTDLLQGGEESIVGTIENVDGKHIHNALQESFDFLKTIKNPSSSQIKEHLGKAFKLAEKHLDTAGLPVGEHKSFLKSIISEYGGDALRARSTGSAKLDMMPEMPILMPLDFSVDKALAGNLKSNPIGSVIRGSSDLAIVDSAKKIGTIVDYKNLFSSDSAELLRKSIESGQVWQPKLYALSLFNTYSEDELQNIQFRYELSKPGKDGARMRETIAMDFDRSQVGSLQKEVMEQIAKMESMQHTIFNVMKSGDMEGLKKYVANNMGKGCIPPSSCAMCPLKRTCTHGPFAEKVFNPREGIDGSNTISTDIKKLKSYMDPEVVQRQSELYEKQTSKKMDEFIKRRTSELREKGYRGFELSKRVSSEAEQLSKSYDSLKMYTRGKYKDAATGSAISARTKIPFSIIDSEHIHAPWLSKKTRSTLEYLSKERIKEVTGALDIKHELVMDDVLERVYQDDEFVTKLESYMAGKYRSAMEKHGLPYTDESIRKLQMRPGLVMDRHFAQTIQGELDRATVGEVLRHESDHLEKYLGKLDPKRMRTQNNLQAITSGLVEQGVIKSNPDLFLNQLSKGTSFGAVVEKFRMSAKKFPLTAAMSTFFLSYLAGTSTIQSMVMRKMEKATEYMAGAQDNEVRTGQHSSAYTTARRLLLSDFGSPTRWFNPRSGLIGKFMTGMTNRMKSFVDDAIKAKGIAGMGDTDAIDSGSSGTIRKFISSIGESPSGPAAAFAAAAGGMFLLSGPGVNIRSDRSGEDEYKDRNRRFKRIKRSTWNKDSAMLAKESELRRGYKLHTDFGSGLLQIARGIKTIYTDMLTPYNLPKVWNNFRGELEGAVKSLHETYQKTKAIWVDRNNPMSENVSELSHSLKKVVSETSQKLEIEANKYRGTNLKDNIKSIVQKENTEALREGTELNKNFDKSIRALSTTDDVSRVVDISPSSSDSKVDAPLVSDKSLYGKGAHRGHTEAIRFNPRYERSKKYYTNERSGKLPIGSEEIYYGQGKRYDMYTGPGEGMSEFVHYSLNDSYKGINYDNWVNTQKDPGMLYSVMKKNSTSSDMITYSVAHSGQTAPFSMAEYFSHNRTLKHSKGQPVVVRSTEIPHKNRFNGNNWEQNRLEHSRYTTSLTMDSSNTLKNRKYSYNQSGSTLFFDAVNSLNGIGLY